MEINEAVVKYCNGAIATAILLISFGGFFAYGFPGLLIGFGSCLMATGCTGWAVAQLKRESQTASKSSAGASSE